MLNFYVRAALISVLYWSMYVLFASKDLMYDALILYILCSALLLLAFLLYYRVKFYIFANKLFPVFDKHAHMGLLRETILESEKSLQNIDLPHQKYLKYASALFSVKHKEVLDAKEASLKKIDTLITKEEIGLLKEEM